MKRNFVWGLEAGVYSVVSTTDVGPVSGLTLDEAAAFLAGVRARRAADRR